MRPLAQLVAFIYTGELSERGREEILGCVKDGPVAEIERSVGVLGGQGE